MSECTSVHIDRALARLRAGDVDARHELVKHACDRLQRLTRKMLNSFATLRRWEQTGDVFQNAVIRLNRSLQDITPTDTRHFYRIAALQIRRELLDLARHYRGPYGQAANEVPQLPSEEDTRNGPLAVAQPSLDPAHVALWTELHENIARLPEEEREVVELLWYQGLQQAEVANILGVTDRTVRRRWQAARLKLHELLKDMPEVFGV